MGATTMPLTNLLKRLKEDFPTLTFVEGEHFLWSPEENTIVYKARGDNDTLLHEVAHAKLNHQGYARDVELVAMERTAWSMAERLAAQYNLTIDSEIAENHLDTYRDWLHARSTCPACTATGYQTAANTYTCPACTQSWKVNEARICQLRRVKI